VAVKSIYVQPYQTHREDSPQIFGRIFKKPWKSQCCSYSI